MQTERYDLPIVHSFCRYRTDNPWHLSTPEVSHLSLLLDGIFKQWLPFCRLSLCDAFRQCVHERDGRYGLDCWCSLCVIVIEFVRKVENVVVCFQYRTLTVETRNVLVTLLRIQPEGFGLK